MYIDANKAIIPVISQTRVGSWYYCIVIVTMTSRVPGLGNRSRSRGFVRSAGSEECRLGFLCCAHASLPIGSAVIRTYIGKVSEWVGILPRLSIISSSPPHPPPPKDHHHHHPPSRHVRSRSEAQETKRTKFLFSLESFSLST